MDSDDRTPDSDAMYPECTQGEVVVRLTREQAEEVADALETIERDGNAIGWTAPTGAVVSTKLRRALKALNALDGNGYA